MPKSTSSKGRLRAFKNSRRKPTPAGLPPRWLLSLGLLCCLWPKPEAKAQQALLSALSLDSTIQSRSTSTNPIVTLPPDQPHLGPVGLNLGVYSGVTENDNINLTSQNTIADLILGYGVDVGVAWQATGKSILQFNSRVGYNYYLRHPGHSYLQIAPGSALTWDLNAGDWDFIFFDQFNYSRNDVAQASVSNVSGIPLVNNNIGLRAQWKTKDWFVDLGYSYNDEFSTSSQYNYLDNGANQLFARGAWRFSENGQLGVENSATFTHFAHPPQTDNSSYSVGPYLQWPLDRSVNLSFHGGPTFYNFASSPQGQTQNGLNSYYVTFDVTHQIDEFISEELYVNRTVSLGFLVGATYTEELDVAYIVNWYLKPWLLLRLSLNYQNGQQPLEQIQFFQAQGLLFEGLSTTTEKYSRYGFSPTVSYRLTRKINTSLSYTHWTRVSNISLNGYGDDAVNFQVEYSF